MLRVEVCDGARTCVEVRGGAGGARGVRRLARDGEPTGFSASGVRKSPYLQNKSFLAS